MKSNKQYLATTLRSQLEVNSKTIVDLSMIYPYKNGINLRWFSTRQTSKSSIKISKYLICKM